MAFTGCGSAFGREIAPGVHIVGPTRGALKKGGYSKSYLFEEPDDGTLALVDTGWDDDARVILGYLDDIGRSPRQLEHIVITHAHRSHLGGVARLKELSGARVSCHAEEAPIVEGDRRAKRIRPWPWPPVLFLFRVASWLPWVRHKRCDVDHYLVDEEVVGPLTVIHTPGHTPGHLVLSYGETVLAVGDAVATWPKFAAGWPGFNRNERLYRKSLVQVVNRSPSVVGPGHGEAIVEDTAARLRTLIQGRKYKDLDTTA